MKPNEVLEYVYENKTTKWLNNLGNRIAARMIGEGSLLNVGCGFGHLFDYIDRGEGLDISEEAISVAEADYHEHIFIVDDIHNMTWIKDNAYDNVAAIGVLEHLKDLPKALKEIKRVLKPGGEFVAMIPAEGMMWQLGRWLTTRRKFGSDYDDYIKEQHVNSTEKVLEEVGNHFDVLYGFGFPFGILSKNLNLLIFMKGRNNELGEVQQV